MMAGGRVPTAGWERLAVAALFALAAAQYGWNCAVVTPLSGYDGGAHAAYILTILEDGRLPAPREGWSTFHPPTYYLLAAAVWRLAEPFGPLAVVAAVRAISALAILASAWIGCVLLRRRAGDPWVRLATLALLLFVPCVQLAGTWFGNEALGVVFASLALPLLLALQRDPSDTRGAALLGACVGLALATKYTGALLALAAVVPFARRGLGPEARRAALTGAFVAVAIAGPVYLRNVVQTGSPVPMTRDVGVTRALEESLELRPRRIGDYLSFPLEAVRRPSVFHIEGGPQPGVVWNESMQSVWALAYASLWYDALAHRIPLPYHRDGIRSGPRLLALGAIPTLLVLLGFARATRQAWRSRGRSQDAPLVAMSLAALALFVVFTWRADALVSAKASYLLPLLLPAALFFAAALESLPARLRTAALVVSFAAAAASALVFTSDLVFPRIEAGRVRSQWLSTAKHMPGTYLDVAVQRLIEAPAEGAGP